MTYLGMTTPPEIAAEEGVRARQRMLELDACPYTEDADDMTREYDPPACIAWRKAWRWELERQFEAAKAGRP